MHGDPYPTSRARAPECAARGGLPLRDSMCMFYRPPISENQGIPSRKVGNRASTARVAASAAATWRPPGETCGIGHRCRPTRPGDARRRARRPAGRACSRAAAKKRTATPDLAHIDVPQLQGGPASWRTPAPLAPANRERHRRSKWHGMPEGVTTSHASVRPAAWARPSSRSCKRHEVA